MLKDSILNSGNSESAHNYGEPGALSLENQCTHTAKTWLFLLNWEFFAACLQVHSTIHTWLWLHFREALITVYDWVVEQECNTCTKDQVTLPLENQCTAVTWVLSWMHQSSSGLKIKLGVKGSTTCRLYCTMWGYIHLSQEAVPTWSWPRLLSDSVQMSCNQVALVPHHRWGAG